MVPNNMDALEWLRKHLDSEGSNLLCEMVRTFAERLMAAEVDVVCNAGYGEITAERTNSRNGYRSRQLDTSAAGEAIALGRHRRHLRAVDTVTDALVPARPLLELGDGDYDVDEPDLDLFGSIGPHPDDYPGVDRRSDGHTEPGFSGCECFGVGSRARRR